MSCPDCQSQDAAGVEFCPSCGSKFGVEADPLLGSALLGKYTVKRVLGEGGMGRVYEAEQSLGPKKRRVAIKTLHKHLSLDASIRARFQREVGTLASLDHPNTIQVFDFGVMPDGMLFIVMEFVHGSSVAAVLEHEGPMTPDRVAHIVAQVCGSLEEAHAQGIVHRDLKPDNVELTEHAGQKDFVKLLDFGIAKIDGQEAGADAPLTQQGSILGTPPYMSPEQFTGKSVDARSDIYSLAVMAYEMLTGRLPFTANTPWEWATQHMTQAPMPIEQAPNGDRIPPGMRGAIHRALEKSPDARHPSVRVFAEHFVRGVEVPAEASAAATSPTVLAPSTLKGNTQVGEPVLPAASPSGQTEVGVPLTPSAYQAPNAPDGAQGPHHRGAVAGNDRGEVVGSDARDGSSRKPLLLTAALLAVVSGGLIAVAMLPGKPKPAPLAVDLAPSSPTEAVSAASDPTTAVPALSAPNAAPAPSAPASVSSAPAIPVRPGPSPRASAASSTTQQPFGPAFGTSFADRIRRTSKVADASSEPF